MQSTNTEVVQCIIERTRTCIANVSSSRIGQQWQVYLDQLDAQTTSSSYQVPSVFR